MKTKLILCLIATISLLFSCNKNSSLQQVLRTSGDKTESSCEAKGGYWYKGKCWSSFEDEGIAVKDIDSVVTAQVKQIEKSSVNIDGEEHPLTFFFPEKDGKQIIFITMFSVEGKTQTLLQIVKAKDISEEDMQEQKVIDGQAILLQGNIMEVSEDEEKMNKLMESSEFSGPLKVEVVDFSKFHFNFQSRLVSAKTSEEKLISYAVSDGVMGAGTSTIEVKGKEAFVNGELGTLTYAQMKDMLEKHPEVETLVLGSINGSVNDAVNMHTGRLVREAGLTTKVLSTSDIASGGVDLFCAGKKRIVHKGAKVGVHSWGGPGYTAIDLPRDHPAHQYQLEYFTLCLGKEKGPAFYFYTLEAAEFADIHWMSDEEIKSWEVATDFIE